MTAKPQLIYVLYGTDRFTRDEQVRGLKRRALEDDCGEYNLTELIGQETGLAAVREAADAFPFMAERRVVIVHGLIGRLSGSAPKGGARRGRQPRRAAVGAPTETTVASPLQALLEYLPQVPASTALVLVEDQFDPSLVEPYLPAGRAHVRAYNRPRTQDLPGWIDRRARHHGGRVEASAARQLAQLALEDLGMLDNEIRKLITYAADRPVTGQDVDLLCPAADFAVFAFIDAVSDGQRGRALGHLRSLVARGERAEAIVPQLAGALRRLIQARTMLDQGLRGLAVREALGVHPFVAEKTERQAAGFRIDQLEAALRLLLGVDRSIKTGEAEPELALELFVVDMPRG